MAASWSRGSVLDSTASLRLAWTPAQEAPQGSPISRRLPPPWSEGVPWGCWGPHLSPRSFVWRWPLPWAKLDCCESGAAPALEPLHRPVLCRAGCPQVSLGLSHLLWSLLRCHPPSEGFSDCSLCTNAIQIGPSPVPAGFLSNYHHLMRLLLPGFCFGGSVCPLECVS